MNPFLEVPHYALRNLAQQGLRSYLTLLGVVIGIAAMVTLFSLGTGLNKAAEEQFETLGSNTLFLTPSARFQQGGGPLTNFKTLTPSFRSRIETLSEVESTLAPVAASGTIVFGRENIEGSIIATTSEEAETFEETGFVELEAGRSFTTRDTFSVIVGHRIAHDVFSRDIRLGSRITIEGKSFSVIGITKESARSYGGGPNTNNTLFITKQGFSHLFTETDSVFMLIKTHRQEDVPIVQRKVERLLEDEWGRDQGFYVVATQEQLLGQISQFLGLIQLVLVGIASISLLVGGIGIMNTMIMAVLERTAEIGVMKAVGATNALVLSIFLMEAGFIGAIGGALGVLLGYALAFLVGHISTSSGLALNVVADPLLMAGAILFAMLVGMLSGLIPARRAAMLDPVIALRGVE